MAKKQISPLQKALNLWPVILIIWSFYRAKLVMPAWIDEFIAKPMVFIFPVFYYITNKEKKNFFHEIYLKPSLIYKDLILTALIGGLFIMAALFAHFIKYGSLPLFSSYDLNKIGYVFLLALATGISEEILSRGFVVKKLYEDNKNILTASFFGSILFFFLHVPILCTNANITGNLLLFFMISDLLLSIVLSFIFLIRKSLALPIFIHTLYKAIIVLFI